MTRGEEKASCGPVRGCVPTDVQDKGCVLYNTQQSEGKLRPLLLRLQMARRMSKDMKQGGRSPGETCFLLWHKTFPRS